MVFVFQISISLRWIFWYELEDSDCMRICLSLLLVGVVNAMASIDSLLSCLQDPRRAPASEGDPSSRLLFVSSSGLDRIYLSNRKKWHVCERGRLRKRSHVDWFIPVGSVTYFQYHSMDNQDHHDPRSAVPSIAVNQGNDWTSCVYSYLRITSLRIV